MNIVFFDTETTGTDICKDRICQISTLKMDADFNELEPIKKRLINPGIPIPPGATAVHGITDDMVRNAPKFSQIATSLFGFLEGCALGGYNIIQFDVPLLAEEFIRVGKEWPAPGTLLADAFKVFIQKERRDLSAAAEFYLNEKHEGAHDAGADVIMSWKVLAAQLSRYEDLKGGSLEDLHKFCLGEMAVDMAGKLKRDEQGIIVYSFGKDKDLPVKTNPGFAQWMLANSFPIETKRKIRQILSGEIS